MSLEITPGGYTGTEVYDLPEGRLVVERVFEIIGGLDQYICWETLRTAYLDGQMILDWRYARELYARARLAEAR